MKNVLGTLFTIHVSRNHAVSCEVQTPFGSFPLAKFLKNALETFS